MKYDKLTMEEIVKAVAAAVNHLSVPLCPPAPVGRASDPMGDARVRSLLNAVATLIDECVSSSERIDELESFIKEHAARGSLLTQKGQEEAKRLTPERN